MTGDSCVWSLDGSGSAGLDSNFSDRPSGIGNCVLGEDSERRWRVFGIEEEKRWIEGHPGRYLGGWVSAGMGWNDGTATAQTNTPGRAAD